MSGIFASKAFMLSFFRNCKHCGLSLFHNDFHRIDFFCEKCWIKLFELRCVRGFKTYKNSFVEVSPLFLWREKDSIVGDLIHGLKGGTPEEILKKFAREISYNHTETTSGTVIPVPSSKVGEKDHAYKIAKIISEETGLVFWNGLRWKKKNVNQKFLSKTERFISEMELVESLPKVNKLILVDDLVTTGATALAARKAIKSLNKVEVWSLACRI